MTKQEIELNRRKYSAEQLRYKKPIMKRLNIDTIVEELYQMSEDCDAVAYAYNTTEEDDILTGLTDDEDYVYLFKTQFMDLSADLSNMQEDMNDKYIPEYFDMFFAACNPKRGQLLGYDMFEGDYYGLSDFEEELAEDNAKKVIERLNKKEMMDVAQRCIKIGFQFLSLQYRYWEMKMAIDVIKGTNVEMLQAVKGIEEMYKAYFDVPEDKRRDEWDLAWYMDKEVQRKWRHLEETLPAEVWLQ